MLQSKITTFLAMTAGFCGLSFSYIGSVSQGLWREEIYQLGIAGIVIFALWLAAKLYDNYLEARKFED